MSVQLVFPMRVIDCTERTQRGATHKLPDGTAHEETRSLGFFVRLSGLGVAIFVGEENPGFAPGDEVDLVLRKR